MLMLTGQVFTVFRTPLKRSKDGNEYGGDDRVQVLAMVPMDNGTEKAELIDIKVTDARLFVGRESEDVQIPVGAFAPGKGQIRYFQTGEPIFARGESSLAGS